MINASDKTELQTAKNLLENPGFAIKISNIIGTPIEQGIKLLPDNWNKSIGNVTKIALEKAADTAMFTLKDTPYTAHSTIWHKIGGAACGGVGGFFGISALAIELPISTTIILRSIADIARSQGESINNINTKSACLEVFALGGRSNLDDRSESGYFAVRSTISKHVTYSAEHLILIKNAEELAKKAAEKAATEAAKNAAKEAAEELAKKTTPIMIELIKNIAERFGIQVTEKAAAQAIPFIGAAGGAIINTLFMDHFQDMAKGHFVVRKLERKYGKEQIKNAYDNLPKNN